MGLTSTSPHTMGSVDPRGWHSTLIPLWFVVVMLWSTHLLGNKIDDKRLKSNDIIHCVFAALCVQTYLLYIMTNRDLNLPTILISYHQILFEKDFIPTHNWLPSYVVNTFPGILIWLPSFFALILIWLPSLLTVGFKNLRRRKSALDVCTWIGVWIT
jgi:hypothetical protein